MQSGRLALLAISLLTASAPTASAASATASGQAALALAGVVALYSPLLTSDEREAVLAFFVGQSGIRYAKKISVTADKIVCRVSNVDITARSCELTFRGAKQTITGRRASEIFAPKSCPAFPPTAPPDRCSKVSRSSTAPSTRQRSGKRRAAAPTAPSRRETKTRSGREGYESHALHKM